MIFRSKAAKIMRISTTLIRTGRTVKIVTIQKKDDNLKKYKKFKF
jgi:hypothetical protein